MTQLVLNKFEKAVNRVKEYDSFYSMYVNTSDSMNSTFLVIQGGPFPWKLSIDITAKKEP